MMYADGRLENYLQIVTSLRTINALGNTSATMIHAVSLRLYGRRTAVNIVSGSVLVPTNQKALARNVFQ